MSLTELFRNARAYDNGPSEFLAYREFTERLARFSRFDDTRDFLLMRSCRESRRNPMRVRLRELSMITYGQTIDCGGATQSLTPSASVL